MSTHSTATVLANYRKRNGRRLSRKSVVAIIFDGCHCLTHTEETLDAWWNSLDAEQKAEIYELDLGPEELPAVDAQPYPWSILAEADRVSANLGTLTKAPLAAADLLESGGHHA